MSSLIGGGAEKVLVDILEKFDYVTYDVTLLLVRREGVHLSRLPRQVKLLSLDSFTGYRPKYIVNKFTVIMWNKYVVNSVLGPSRFDTIISFMEGEALYFHSLITRKARRNISWVHIDLKSNHWSSRFFKSLKHEAKAYGKMDSIIFVSQKAREQFFDLFDLKANGKVIYNLIDGKTIIEKSQEYDIRRSSTFTICNVGRLSEQKRQDRLIEAVSILKKHYSIEVELWILGMGHLEESLRKQAKYLGVESQVKFWGFKANPYPYIAKADAFVLSSDTEGYPLVLCEAVCLCKPVVSTNVTGTKEVLGDNCGILCGTESTELAKAISLLVSDKTALAQQIKRSEERSQIFNIGKTMSQIYDEIQGNQ